MGGKGGIFTCNWGSFHLGWQGEQQEKERTKWELSLPLFPGPRQSQPTHWRWCISDQRASELSAALASSATWLLLDRFVPLIREYSDCRHCLCTEMRGGGGGGGKRRIQHYEARKADSMWESEFTLKGTLPRDCVWLIFVIISCS